MLWKGGQLSSQVPHAMSSYSLTSKPAEEDKAPCEAKGEDTHGIAVCGVLFSVQQGEGNSDPHQTGPGLL